MTILHVNSKLGGYTKRKLTAMIVLMSFLFFYVSEFSKRSSSHMLDTPRFSRIRRHQYLHSTFKSLSPTRTPSPSRRCDSKNYCITLTCLKKQNREENIRSNRVGRLWESTNPLLYLRDKRETKEAILIIPPLKKWLLS